MKCTSVLEFDHDMMPTTISRQNDWLRKMMEYLEEKDPCLLPDGVTLKWLNCQEDDGGLSEFDPSSEGKGLQTRSLP